jgi:hypothetical protein
MRASSGLLAFVATAAAKVGPAQRGGGGNIAGEGRSSLDMPASGGLTMSHAAKRHVRVAFVAWEGDTVGGWWCCVMGG